MLCRYSVITPKGKLFWYFSMSQKLLYVAARSTIVACPALLFSVWNLNLTHIYLWFRLGRMTDRSVGASRPTLGTRCQAADTSATRTTSAPAPSPATDRPTGRTDTDYCSNVDSHLLYLLHPHLQILLYKYYYITILLYYNITILLSLQYYYKLSKTGWCICCIKSYSTFIIVFPILATGVLQKSILSTLFLKQNKKLSIFVSM